MSTYTIFLRSARNFSEFSSAEKEVWDTGLSYGEAQDSCRLFNENRTDAQVEAGTKMEFTEDGNI